MAVTVPVNENIITWALSRAGYDLPGFMQKHPSLKVDNWLRGDKEPTVKQLEAFSKKVHVPFGYLFLTEPPNEELKFPFFRAGQAKAHYRVSLNVYDAILQIERRQQWLRDYLIQLEHDPLDFVGKYTVAVSVEELVADIRDKLGLKAGWTTAHPTWEDTLGVLMDAIETIGVIVVQNGVVGNNTHRPIPVDECRGFVLVDDYVPFMFVNNVDAKAAQMFTLIHELAHIWLGKSAGFNQDRLISADDPIEILCDQVAAEFLVPKDTLQGMWTSAADIRKLAARFKVSPIVIARRAMDLELLSRADFFAFYAKYMEGIQSKKEEGVGGGNFYYTAKRRVSPTFAGYVDNAVKNGALTYRGAFKLTGLNGDVYSTFINDYLVKV